MRRVGDWPKLLAKETMHHFSLDTIQTAEEEDINFKHQWSLSHSSMTVVKIPAQIQTFFLVLVLYEEIIVL